MSNQTKNLYNNSEYKKAVDELTKRIIQHSIRVDSPGISWLAASLK